MKIIRVVDVLVIRRVENWIFGLLCLYSVACDLSLPLANFAIDVALILWGVHVFFTRDFSLPDRRLLFLLGLYIFAISLAGFFSYNPRLSVEPVTRSFYYMVLPFLLAWRFIDTEKKANILVGLMVLSVAISSIFAVYQASNGVFRAGGFIGMLETASHIVQVSPILLTLLYYYSNQSRPAILSFLVVFVLMLAALMVTNNRQSWLAQVLVFVLFGVIAKVSWKKWLVALMVVALAVSLVISFSPNVKQRIQHFADRDESTTGRFSMWKTAVSTFVDHPIIGVGPNNSVVVDHIYIHPDRLDRRAPMTHPHNSYLQLLAETGLLGFLSYGLLYGYILLIFYRQYRCKQKPWALGVFLSVIAIQFAGLTENFLFGVLAVKQSEWFIIGIAWRNKEAESL